MSWLFSRIGTHSLCSCVVTPFESLQHLIALDEKSAMAKVIVRKYRAPDRMRMQDRACIEAADNCKVQQCFCRGFAVARCHDVTLGIDFYDLFRRQASFIQRTGGDRKAERIPAHDRAEVSAGS